MNTGENQVDTELEGKCAATKPAYETPEFILNDLASIVLSGPTGGGDSGQTMLPDVGDGDEHGLDEEDYYFG